jgi:3-phenylpropionate/trans-cinnamate dioxygenase ferredoxin reductase subunit
MRQNIVIVGAGHCAGQAAVSLREQGFDGTITLVGEEAHPPYERPPLSKKFLAGEIPVERTYFRPADFYQTQDVTLRLGMRVEAIERDRRRVVLGDGESLPYDQMLLATGSRPRRLNLPGANLAGVCYLRNIADVDTIRSFMGPGKSMAVVGGGYIGLEVAAVGIQSGMKVTLLEVAERILNRVTVPKLSDFFTRFHEARGAEVRCDTRVTGFEGAGRVERVLCEDGPVEADLVVVGVGILPNVELAQTAGLDCDNGILVDEFCRTKDPRVFAAGDCTNHPNPLLKRRLRLESVHNALEQAKTAAANLCGRETAYAQIPWFWSDQHDLKLQIVGLSGAHDQIVLRGDMAGDSFALFYLKDGVVIAVDAVNRPREFMASRRIIPRQARIEPERLADSSIPMQELI